MPSPPPPRPISVRPYHRANDEAWLRARLAAEWGGAEQARRGELVDVAALDGFVAEVDGEPAGVLTHRRDGDATELALLWAFTRRIGIGRALVRALLEVAQPEVWAVTTNDNVGAIACYERCGFVVREVRRGAVDDARARLKPSIPLVGEHGVRIRDEVELVCARGPDGPTATPGPR